MVSVFWEGLFLKKRDIASGVVASFEKCQAGYGLGVEGTGMGEG